LAENGHGTAFTPAVILFIALPESKDNIDPGVVPLDLLPRRCPICGNCTIIGHGRRLRPAHDDRRECIWVRRGICLPCGKTFTILPAWLAPSGHYTLHCRQQACERIAAGESAEQAAPHCKDPTRLPDSSSVRRWAQRRWLSVWCWLTAGAIGGALFEGTHHPCLGSGCGLPYSADRGKKSMSRQALDELKQQIPLLDYLQALDWQPTRQLSRGRLMGLCPLHSDHKPSFLVDPTKCLFYCYGCGRGGDVIRFVETFHQVKFPQALTLLRQWRGMAPLLHETASFYRMLFTLGWNEPPQSASALGGIFRWKDGRNMPDLHTVLFDYHGTPVYVRLGLGTETPELARFMGPKGILDATGSELRQAPQHGVDTEPSYYSGGFPAKMREEYTKQWYAEHYVTPGREPLSDEARRPWSRRAPRAFARWRSNG
jgi:hypothetical protein